MESYNSKPVLDREVKNTVPSDNLQNHALPPYSDKENDSEVMDQQTVEVRRQNIDALADRITELVNDSRFDNLSDEEVRDFELKYREVFYRFLSLLNASNN